MPNYCSINLRNEKDTTKKGVTPNMARNYISIIKYGSAVSLWFPCLHKGNENKSLEEKILYTVPHVEYLSVIYMIILTS
jgi:hypothetical protein